VCVCALIYIYIFTRSLTHSTRVGTPYAKNIAQFVHKKQDGLLFLPDSVDSDGAPLYYGDDSDTESCPDGTRWVEESGRCVSCPQGSYGSSGGCNACPYVEDVDRTTFATGMKSEQSCYFYKFGSNAAAITVGIFSPLLLFVYLTAISMHIKKGGFAEQVAWKRAHRRAHDRRYWCWTRVNDRLFYFFSDNDVGKRLLCESFLTVVVSLVIMVAVGESYTRVDRVYVPARSDNWFAFVTIVVMCVYDMWVIIVRTCQRGEQIAALNIPLREGDPTRPKIDERAHAYAVIDSGYAFFVELGHMLVFVCFYLDWIVRGGVATEFTVPLTVCVCVCVLPSSFVTATFSIFYTTLHYTTLHYCS
jgi:hypothetical protein